MTGREGRAHGFCGVYTRDRPKPALHAISGDSWGSRRQTVQVVFDGNIYNRTELRRELTTKGFRFHGPSDSELLSHLYEDRGIDGLHKLRGVFSFALLDRSRDLFYLVRDRLGVKPIYYALTSHSVVFASRVASIFSASAIRPEINMSALRYFLFGVRNAPETIFRSVLTVPPGHYLLLNRNGSLVREYWDVKFPEEPAEPGRPASDYVEELDALLAETVRLYMENDDRHMALLLSGGLDSSLLACYASEARKLNTYTIMLKPRRKKSEHEWDYAQLMAHRVASRHAKLRYKRDDVNAYFLETLGQSECPTYEGDIEITIPFYLISRKMSEDGIKVVLSGGGMDEIFGGYLHYKAEKIRAWCEPHPEGSWRHQLYRKAGLRPGEDHHFFQQAHTEILQTYGHNVAYLAWIKGFAYIRENLTNLLADDVVATLGDKLTSKPWIDIDPAKYRRYHPLDQTLYLDIKTRLPDFLLLGDH